MNTLINFFVLRPTFTFFGLRVLWYAYLANTILQTYNALSNASHALAQRGLSIDFATPGFLFLIFGTIVQLSLGRLLLEVAAIIISNAAGSRDSR